MCCDYLVIEKSKQTLSRLELHIKSTVSHSSKNIMTHLGDDWKACIPPREAFASCDGFDKYYINKVNAVIFNTKTGNIANPMKNPTTSGNIQVEFVVDKGKKKHPLVKDLLYATWLQLGPIPKESEVLVADNKRIGIGVDDLKLVSRKELQESLVRDRTAAHLLQTGEWWQHPMFKNYFANSKGEIYSTVTDKTLKGNIKPSGIRRSETR